MKKPGSRQEKTRQAILAALAAVVSEVGPGFSVQQVADRAGVTHRTVYNHFPTRQDLNDGLAVWVEEQLAQLGPPPDESTATLSHVAAATDGAFDGFGRMETHVRAYVMLMLASRAPARLTRERTERFQRVVQKELGCDPEQARLLTAALRHFLSATGWHVLTEHYGLTTSQASRTAGFAVRALIRAAQRGELPEGGE